MQKILVFYDRNNVDAFVAAHAAWIHLPKNTTGFISVGKGEILPDLSGKYLLFFGVDFLSLKEVPDMSKAINGVFVGRFAQFEVFRSMKLFPKTFRYHSNDVESISALAWRHYVMSPERRSKIIPSFIQHLLSVFGKEEEDQAVKDLLLGLQHTTELSSADPAGFDAKYVAAYKEDPIKTVTELAVEGSKRSGSNMLFVTKIIERNTLVTNFLNHDVKLCQAPEELSDEVGRYLSQGVPFAVVYEDHLSEQKRSYKLYSDKNGLDVMEVAKSCNPVGNARRASFSIKINFSKHNWV